MEQLEREVEEEEETLTEEERRERGMSTALDASNKGSAMLKKMGHKKGQSLGKDGSGGIVNPIEIQMRVAGDRSGIGFDSESGSSILDNAPVTLVAENRDGGQRPSGEEDDDGGADGLGEEGGHVGGREEVLEDQGEGELALGRFGFGGRGLDAAQHVASATD